jgi:hypothetical protein
MPKRIQRKRTKGWRIEGAVYVGRPTLWGNPWRAGELCAPFWAEHCQPPDAPSWFGRPANDVIRDAADAVEMYRKWIVDVEQRGVPLPIHRLRGKNLACWCPLDQPCHADVLLELANA